MKKLALLLFIAILLTACQPTVTPQPTAIPPTQPPAPAPTSASVETLVSSPGDLVGIWIFTVKVEFKADGTDRIYFGSDSSPDLIDEGSYTFDAGKVTWATGSACKEPATYEAYVTKQDGKPAWLRLQVVGSDPCTDRADILKRPGKFYAPSTAAPTQVVIEQLAGEYLTHIGQGGAAYGIEDGQYLLKLREDLRWFVVDPNDGFVYTQGYYTNTADQIVIKGTGGPAIGSCVNIENTYGWSAEGDALTFTAISVDAKCEGEKYFFTVNPFVLQP